MALLTLQGLTKHFAGLTAVRDVTCHVDKGELVGFIGPNGAGKTTLLSMVAGALSPSSGEIRLQDENVTDASPHEMARRGAIRTYQRTSVFADSSTLENVRIGCHMRTSLNLFAVVFNRPAAMREEVENKARARSILEFVGLTGRESVLARNLPYGDQRRLGIAIALGGQPSLLMLDEPAAGMNPEEVGRLMDLVRSIRERGVTVVLVEHNMRMVMNLCDRVIVLDHGELIAQGTPAEVASDPRVIQVYLGRSRDHAAP